MSDNTGRLMCAFTSDVATGQPLARRAAVPVETPARAASLSLECARRLRMIPLGAEAALDGDPVQTSRKSRWHVAWLVRKEPSARPYVLTVQLSSKNRGLVSAANGDELADFVAR